jgi:UDP-N-acetylmuramoyl-tripeptide--D-alanyl-D-alanine ligase
VFVALPGENFDGHDFIETAVKAGAQGIVCRQDFKLPSGIKADLYRVSDTLEAYRTLAHAWRKRFNIPVLAVAGSVGKTSTKEMLAAILRGKWQHVLKTEGSQNGFVGIPMTLLELRPEHQAAVIEIGIDEIGAMDLHMRTVEPTAAVITAIAAEHLEKLRDLPTVAREEILALTMTAAQGGTIVINEDDSWIHSATSGLQGEGVYHLSLNGYIKPSERHLVGRLDGTDLIVDGMGLSSLRLTPPLPGRNHARNLLCAIALARSVGLSATEIAHGLKTFSGAPGRAEIKALANGAQVICDFYNASPASMHSGLELLRDLSATRQGRTWACLGDMLELGRESKEAHRTVGERAAKTTSMLITVGFRARAMGEAALDAGMDENKIREYEQGEALRAAKELRLEIKKNDMILIKGSQGMRMEFAVKELMARPDLAPELLVRQEEEWERR